MPKPPPPSAPPIVSTPQPDTEQPPKKSDPGQPIAVGENSLPRIKPVSDNRRPKPSVNRGATRPAKTRSKPTSLRKVSSTEPLAIDAEETDPLAPEDLSEVAARSAPAWLVSLVFHTLLIIALALIYVAKEIPQSIALDATYAETLGEQLEDDTFQAASTDALDLKDPLFSLDVLAAENPLARPPDITPRLDGFLPTDAMTAPSIGLALTGRERGMKEALLAKYGGTATTEAAVARALEWLKLNQRRDGAWSLKGPYTQGSFDENKTAATAMALLAFQGAGHTHKSGKYKEEVNRGWRSLLKMQDKDGNFYHGEEDGHRLYSQAQAMIAVCEIYGMTQDEMFREPAQRAIDYAVQYQAPEGGWRYRPGVGSDTSVTGWFVMGLQSGLMAGLDVPSPTLQRVSEYLDSVAMYGGSFYKYQPIRKGFTPAMTAEGLLCREYLGWKQNDPRFKEGAEFLLENPVDWQERDVYYWYYATQTLHHLEGPDWDKWNRVMRNVLPKNQVLEGPEKGSWDPEGDRWGAHGGRLFTTCLSTYMLEVYYRHLPIYAYRLN